MTPIVNGLEEQYAEEVDFQLLDASLGKGKRLFDHYGNLGHPSYILLDPTGSVEWRGVGPIQMSALEDAILKIIGK